MITQKDIHDFLNSIGIGHEDTLLIHTSMRALGEVEGGCDGVIDSFKSYLSEGLFIVPTHTWASVGKSHPIYDVRTEVPCIGALPTVAAARTDGVRSLHPTHSVAAFGDRAEEYVAGEENSRTPCPAGGAWARLYDEDATVLLIGVGLNRNTYIHAIDEMLDLPDRLAEPIQLTIVDYNGKRYEITYQKHGDTGSENFGVFRAPLEACGALRWGKLGNATVGIFKVRRGTNEIKRLWKLANFDLCKDGREIPSEFYAV